MEKQNENDMVLGRSWGETGFRVHLLAAPRQ